MLHDITIGILAAIVSQPADIILKRTCGQSLGLSECLIVDGPWGLLDLIKEQGWRASFKGVRPRAAMTGVFTAVQFQVYEVCYYLLHCTFTGFICMVICIYLNCVEVLTMKFMHLTFILN